MKYMTHSTDVNTSYATKTKTMKFDHSDNN